MYRFAISALVLGILCSSATARRYRHDHHRANHAIEDTHPSLPLSILTSLSNLVSSIFERHPYHIKGQLKIGGMTTGFGSGGRGRGAIPYGSHLITPNAVGNWGARHGAIGIADGEIWDPRIHSTRTGIELHAGSGDESLGCVVVSRNNFTPIKAKIHSMLDRFGHAYLNVGPEGASITPLPALTLTKAPKSVSDANCHFGHGVAIKVASISNPPEHHEESKHHHHTEYRHWHHRYSHHRHQHTRFASSDGPSSSWASDY